VEERTVSGEAPPDLTGSGVECANASAVCRHKDAAIGDDGFHRGAEAFAGKVPDPGKAERRLDFGSANEPVVAGVAVERGPVGSKLACQREAGGQAKCRQVVHAQLKK
jgi:hypothetical protein